MAGYGWQDAQHLRPGDRLLEPDQSHVTVISSVREEHPDGLTVYNFEVAGLHDYFVSASATDSLVLSHNMCRKTGGGAGSSGLKRGPSTDPMAPHNHTIRTHGDLIEAGGGKIISGGGKLPEQLIPTPGGVKGGRRPDILFETENGTLRGRNVGKVDANGNPIKRELNALRDLNGPGGIPTDFVPYN